jgi:hypothetical protein
MAAATAAVATQPRPKIEAVVVAAATVAAAAQPRPKVEAVVAVAVVAATAEAEVAAVAEPRGAAADLQGNAEPGVGESLPPLKHAVPA